MSLTRAEKIDYYRTLKEKLNRQARQDLFSFTKATFPSFEPAGFHKHYYNVLTEFAHGRIRKLMVFMPPQHGKEISDSTLVLTPKGFARHGDLKVGDYVFGRIGQQVKVLWVSEKVMSEYDVTFSDGSVIQCHGNHEWVVYDRSYAAERRLETKYLISQKLASGIEGKRGHRYRFQVDANVQIQLPDSDLPIHPYVLGAWLGDGTSVSGCITHHKDDIAHIDKIEGIGYSKGAVHVHKTTGAVRTWFLGLQSQLKAAGLLNNKHIPEAYFNSSVQQRLELLAGLIDTDGYIYHKNGRVTFSNINRRLIDDVKRLILSLGCRVTSCEYKPIISTSGINGKNIVLQVSFNPGFDIPCALKRKQSVRISPAKRRRGIVSIVKAKNPERGNCIEVEGGIYLVGETLIPTHNSEGSTRRLPSFVLGMDPDRRLGIVSYSSPKARKFNREIQRIIDTPEYHEIFPDTSLNGSNITTVAGGWLRNADECEIVGHRGGFKTVGVGGPLTGEPVDMLIMDDIYKDAKTAWSPTVRESVNDWYDTVAETRLHNDSQQLIVFTRWHPDDLAGRLLREQGIYSPDNPDGWVVVIYQAIKKGAPIEYDSRQEGEALWPERHSLHKLHLVRKRNPQVFESLYQQDPKPLEGLMYEQGFREYEILPATKKKLHKNYTDTADEGKDYLCSICYIETEIGNFVTDVLYTQKAMEYTEPKTAEMLTKHDTQVAVIESNNGGRGFARAVEKQLRMMGNNKTRIKWFHQALNKAVRIFSHSAEVQNITYFPRGWDRLWPDFYRAITSYMKVGKNDFDDACFVAGTMIATVRGNKPIETIIPGEMVLTPIGPCRVLASGKTGINSHVITTCGLTGTPDHKVFNDGDFVHLNKCMYHKTNKLTLVNLLIWRYKKLLHSMEQPTVSWGREGIISASQMTIRREGALKDFMSQFGNTITRGEYRKATAFIIKTITLLITTLATWSAYRLSNTCRSILRLICRMKGIMQRQLRLFVRPAIKHVSGIKAKRGKGGILSILKHNSGQKRIWFAGIAGRPTNPFMPIRNFVLISAANNSVVNIARSDIRASVLFVEPNSRLLKSSPPKSIERHVPRPVQTGLITSTADVYNIKVEEAGCYYANGILVSNCDALTGTIEFKDKEQAQDLAGYF